MSAIQGSKGSKRSRQDNSRKNAISAPGMTADGNISGSGSISARLGLVVCSVVENRSRETCIAVFNTANASLLEVSVLSDTQSYAQTMAHLESLQPNEVLLHDGTRNRVLSLKVVEAFHQGDESRVLFVSRQYFDQDKGAELLRRLSSKNLGADVFATYIVLAAANCLLRYIENVTGHGHAPSSLRVVLTSGNEGRMVIDRSTAIDLELIVNARAFDQRRSLFGVVNRTKTSVGARLLRSNILSPSTDLPTLEARLDLVEFFLSSEKVFAGVLEYLSRFADLDRMLSGLVTIPKSVTPLTAAKGIETIICLRHTIQLIVPIAQILEEGMNELNNLRGLDENSDECSCDLLKAIVDNLKDSNLIWIEDRINGILTESTTFTKSAIQMRHQECFAVQPDINGMLDVARKTFLQSVEDIYALADAYTRDYPEAPCSVKATAARGYHLQVPSNVPSLPDIYIQAVKSTKYISCTTQQVASLSDRATEALQEALLLTNQVVQDLMETVRGHMESLFAVVESIALLDMLFGFADLVATSRLQYVRPTLIPDGTFSVCNGVHPVVGALIDGNKGYVPNNITMGPLSNFCIVTGANGSGKSTFLKQIACIAVLAQIGCYVPAAAATMPMRDRILTRLATADDMENNLSSFLVEMRETSHALSSATPRSLTLIDELGRGTSTEEGRAIAWAVCEALLCKPGYTLFSTHYAELCELIDYFPNAKNICLISENSAGTVRVHSVATGPSADLSTDYGIQMAEQCGFPPDFIAEARTVRKQLLETVPQLNALVDITGSDRTRKEQKQLSDAFHLLSLLSAAPDMETHTLRSLLNEIFISINMDRISNQNEVLNESTNEVIDT